jgi:PAB1-binding protein PBP1
LPLAQNLYTTRLDASNSKISRGEAERIAAEIMAGNTTNRHSAEERGHTIDDSGVRTVDLLHIGSCRGSCFECGDDVSALPAASTSELCCRNPGSLYMPVH